MGAAMAWSLEEVCSTAEVDASGGHATVAQLEEMDASDGNRGEELESEEEEMEVAGEMDQRGYFEESWRYNCLHGEALRAVLAALLL